MKSRIEYLKELSKKSDSDTIASQIKFVSALKYIQSLKNVKPECIYL